MSILYSYHWVLYSLRSRTVSTISRVTRLWPWVLACNYTIFIELCIHARECASKNLYLFIFSRISIWIHEHSLLCVQLPHSSVWGTVIWPKCPMMFSFQSKSVIVLSKKPCPLIIYLLIFVRLKNISLNSFFILPVMKQSHCRNQNYSWINLPSSD